MSPQNDTFSTAEMWDVYVQKHSQGEFTSVSVANGADLFDHTVVVYPNPSPDVFNIAFEKPVEHAVLIITDIQGKLVSTAQIHNTTKASIELNEAPSVYLLTIKSKDGQKTIQLVKD